MSRHRSRQKNKHTLFRSITNEASANSTQQGFSPELTKAQKKNLQTFFDFTRQISEVITALQLSPEQTTNDLLVLANYYLQTTIAIFLNLAKRLPTGAISILNSLITLTMLTLSSLSLITAKKHDDYQQDFVFERGAAPLLQYTRISFSDIPYKWLTNIFPLQLFENEMAGLGAINTNGVGPVNGWEQVATFRCYVSSTDIGALVEILANNGTTLANDVLNAFFKEVCKDKGRKHTSSGDSTNFHQVAIYGVLGITGLCCLLAITGGAAYLGYRYWNQSKGQREISFGINSTPRFSDNDAVAAILEKHKTRQQQRAATQQMRDEENQALRKGLGLNP